MTQRNKLPVNGVQIIPPVSTFLGYSSHSLVPLMAQWSLYEQV